MVYDLTSVRRILHRLSRPDVDDGDISKEEAAELSEQLMDFRLEHSRLRKLPVSADQLHRLSQLEARLSIWATGHGLPDGIAPEVKRTLESFGWTANT
jgi:hypothetical protein